MTTPEIRRRELESCPICHRYLTKTLADEFGIAIILVHCLKWGFNMKRYEVSTGYIDKSTGTPVTEQMIFTSTDKDSAQEFLNSLWPQLRQEWLCEKQTGGKCYWHNPPRDSYACLELVFYDCDEPVEWELIDERKWGYDEWLFDGVET